MRYYCWVCQKSVTSDLSKDSIIRAVLICPECIEQDKVTLKNDNPNPDPEYAGNGDKN